MNEGTQKVSWDLGTNINQASSSASNTFSDMASNSSSNVIESMGKYNLVGINANQVDDMRFAIRVYVENIESHLNQVVSEAEDTYAFKGQYAESIKEYIQAVCDVVKSLTSQLLAFSDKLVEVKEAYQERDINLTRTISSVASNTQSGVNRYEETK